MQQNSAEKKRFLPCFAIVFYGVAALSLLVYLAAVLFPAFAAWWGGTAGATVRALLAHLTSWVPLSLAELLLYALPLGLVAIGVLAWRKYCETWRETWRFLLALLSCVSLLFSLFVFSFGTGYHTDPLDKRLGLPLKTVDEAALVDTLTALVLEVNAAAEEVSVSACSENLRYILP